MSANHPPVTAPETPPAPTFKPIGRVTVSDLLDPQTMLAWLNADGKPPTVSVLYGARSSSRWHGSAYQTKAVTDEETLAKWWREHRHQNALEWLKSRLNQHKPQTEGQFMSDCLKACGIKAGGTVKERVQRAILMRPDRYTDAATVKAREAAEEAEWQAARKAAREASKQVA